MVKELVRTTSTIGESNLHLQITPAYRRAAFADPQIQELARIFILDKLKKMKVAVLAENCGPDHWHFFLANWKNHSIPKLAQHIKGYSSYMLRKFYKQRVSRKLWGKKFWSEGYFYRTVGVVTRETMQRYIAQSQDKHWIGMSAEQYAARKQTALTDFN